MIQYSGQAAIFMRKPIDPYLKKHISFLPDKIDIVNMSYISM